MSEIVLNTAEQRYELSLRGALAVAAFEDVGDTRVFTHTVVPAALRGAGVGSRLVAAALDDTRRAGLRVEPRCPFVAGYIDAHPDYQDLLA